MLTFSQIASMYNAKLSSIDFSSLFATFFPNEKENLPVTVILCSWEQETDWKQDNF